ncbi:phosphatase PAP2 family protein [Saccharopolyspora sp. TS4A08]|uniref:Phosphatase PAP2 family protein n=1 Tax=Saccharopolyspora ipomoeae TaxID=3042027 RepID=A0ABT6PT15_9PSEU|nr:phosphatase PAP2 family protein [Saccharopolyspora sp. TS4A08]MDI2031123.1 phosphatase PAP2 family protein [Saccharopolyspora sp. TS4A08]
MDYSTDLFLIISGWGAASPGWLQAVALVLTHALLLGFIPVAGYVWWRVDRRARAALAILISGGAAWVLTDPVKDVVRQLRPCRTFPVRTVEHCSEVGVFSFPSGHSATAAAFAVTVAVLWRRAAAIVAVVAVLEAFLRIYLGVHYPHDVLAGLLFGAIIGAIAAVASKPSAKRPPTVLADETAAAQKC